MADEGNARPPETPRPKGTETGKVPGRETGGKGGKSKEKGKANRPNPDAGKTGPAETPRTGGEG